jgi:hypothetical protein
MGVLSPATLVRTGVACGEKIGAGGCAFELTSPFPSLGAAESCATTAAKAAKRRTPVRDKKRLMFE